MTTLITGASGGIGEAFARRLAAENHDLFLVARSEDKLRSLCSELSSKHLINAQFFAADLTQPGADEKVFAAALENSTQIDWLINNAGFGSMGDFAVLDLSRELEMIDLNISALVALTHRFLGPMRESGKGTIINVSSSAGEQPLPFMATYAATKAFVTSFSRAVAEENRPFGIQVLALCPGPTKTNFFEAGNIDKSLAFKGDQTADEVVATALAAVGTGQSKVISGWMNWLVAGVSGVVPHSLVTKVVAWRLREQYQKNSSIPK